MTNATLGRLLQSLLNDMEGSDSFWHGQREEVSVYIVSDEEHDRMRIMSPIGELKRTDAGFLSILLQANFDRALDAKYALRRRELWSVFMHPLSTLVPDDLGLYIDQVVRLVKNTGTTYASSDLIFGISEDDRLDLEYITDDDDEDADADDDSDDEAAASDEDEDEGGEKESGEELTIELEPFDITLDELDDDDDEEDEGEGWKRGAGRGKP
ncbi:MAG: hypothetical protein ACREOU_08025 [Candidatus Eiseniibacteriota bacterium]